MRAENALVVTGQGHRLVMAGGGTTWLDPSLYLIARLAGVEQAMGTARMDLVEWHAVGQQPYARLARSRQSEDALVARCQVRIAEYYDEPAPVAAMVRLSGLLERTFERRFQRATGLSPLEYVHTLRLEEAKQMLEAGSESVEVIGNAVGYEDAGFFGKLFRRRVGLAPIR
jgi:transcriptional regulator GlxA family with amidase domain